MTMNDGRQTVVCGLSSVVVLAFFSEPQRERTCHQEEQGSEDEHDEIRAEEKQLLAK